MWLDWLDEQSITCSLPHHKLIKSHGCASQAEVADNLVGQGHDLAWLRPMTLAPIIRPAVFSDAVIQFCPTIKVPFKLPLSYTTGMGAGPLGMASLALEAPY